MLRPWGLPDRLGGVLGNWAPEKVEAVTYVAAETWDFTANSTGHSYYTNSWTYNEQVSVTHAANNNGKYGYLRVGGKSSASGTSTSGTSTLASVNAINSDVYTIDLTAINVASDSGFTMDSIVLEVASNADFSTLVDTVSGVTVATSMSWTPTTGDHWASGNYYRLTFNWTSTNTSNRGMDVQKVEFKTATASLASVTVSGDMATKSYMVGEDWDPAGLVATAAYDDTSTNVVTDDVTWSYSPEKPEAGVTQVNVTASYLAEGETAAKVSEVFTVSGITVTSRSITSISVVTKPTVTTYEAGDAVSYEGIKVNANYNTGDPVDVTGEVTFDPAAGSVLSTVGDVTVKVAYESLTAEFTITVTPGPIMEYTFESADTYASWTMGTVTLSFTHSLVDASTGELYTGRDGTKGLQLGKGDAPTNATFRSEIISGYRINRIDIEASTGSGGKTTLGIKIGNTAIGSQELTSTSTEYTFNVTTPVAGHIEIDFTNSGTKAQYIKAIQVYADVDSDGVTTAAKLVEAADVCAGTGLTEAIAAYDALTDTAKAECDAIMLDDYQDGDTAHSLAKTYNRLSVAEKMVAIRAAAAEVATTNGVGRAMNGDLSDEEKGSILGISLLVVLGLAGVGGYFLFRQKKEN